MCDVKNYQSNNKTIRQFWLTTTKINHRDLQQNNHK